MKYFKTTLYLFLIATFMVSCDREIALENSELNVQETKETAARHYLSSTIDFYYSESDFGCFEFRTQDFEAARDTDEWFYDPLDEYSDNDIFSPGDILPGISFDGDGRLFINDWASDDYVLMSYYDDEYFNIYFTTGDVYDVSMRMYNDYNNYNEYRVYVYDVEGNYSRAYFDIYRNDNGGFFGVKSDFPISRIRIEAYDDYDDLIGIGPISFGLCPNDDRDGDGCLNGEDAHPFSNMRETVVYDNYFNTDVHNGFVNCGSTMVDELTDAIEEINSEYDGSNWDTLHRKFTRKVARLTYYWRKDRVITRRERSAIYREARNSSIPFMETS